VRAYLEVFRLPPWRNLWRRIVLNMPHSYCVLKEIHYNMEVVSQCDSLVMGLLEKPLTVSRVLVGTYGILLEVPVSLRFSTRFCGCVVLMISIYILTLISKCCLFWFNCDPMRYQQNLPRNLRVFPLSWFVYRF